MGSQGMPEQLNILIVGAGIAGLTAATALKQAGHKVTVIPLLVVALNHLINFPDIRVF